MIVKNKKNGFQPTDTHALRRHVDPREPAAKSPGEFVALNPKPEK